MEVCTDKSSSHVLKRSREIRKQENINKVKGQFLCVCVCVCFVFLFEIGHTRSCLYDEGNDPVEQKKALD